MRKLTIENRTEEKCYVVLDGNIAETILKRESVTFCIDENYHVVQCHRPHIEAKDRGTEVLVTAMNGGERLDAPSNQMEILAGDTDYKFHLESEDVGPSIFGIPFATKIHLIDDAPELAKHRAELRELLKPKNRNVTIINNSEIKEAMNVKLDGVVVKSIQSKETVVIQINEESHTISCFCKYVGSNDILSTEEKRIAYGHMDYLYLIREKNYFGLNIFFKKKIQIELAEDDDQLRKNLLNQYQEKEILEERKRLQKEETEKLEQKLVNILDQELSKKREDWNIDKALRVLTESERKSDIVYNQLDYFAYLEMKAAVNFYCNYEECYLRLAPLKTISEHKDKIQEILKYEDILCNRQQRISSVFTDMDNYADAYAKLEKKYLDKFQGYSIPYEAAKKYADRMKNIKETYSKELEFEKNLELQMFADTDVQEFYELKELLIFMAMNPTPNEIDNVAVKAVNSNYDYFVAPVLATETEFDYLPTVDRIIAKTIVLSRVNLIDNVMDDLQKTLEVIANKDRKYARYKDMIMVTTSQFEVLRKVFEYYKATREEIAVLEAMYTYNIPRTIEQEQRLAFLKKGNSNAPKMYDNTVENEVFRYDYRVLQWSEKDITNYIESFTMNSKKCSVPMAVANFEKSVAVKSFQWENENIIPVLKECLADNFGDRYYVQSVESATVTDSAEDGISAVFISENNFNVKGYPWLGFLVVGDQVTLKQMNLSIYALYLPDRIAEENIMKTNEKIISDVTVLKMKQNPRINNYISTVTNILVEVIEEWINNQISYDIYN